MARIISSDAVINSIRLAEQGSAPDTPASGYGQLYIKDDGKIYFKNDAGAETDLTATGSGVGADGWAEADAMTYAAADDPTFTMTCTGDQSTKYYPGMRIKLTQTSVKYFIITKVAYTSSTTITLYGGTDYDLADAAITNPYYSSAKAPAGFPMDPNKWKVEVTDVTIRSQATPTQDTWYNINSTTISIPIGAWLVSYWATQQSSATADNQHAITLSTANNSESDADMTAAAYVASNSANYFTLTKSKYLATTSKTSYYLNSMMIGNGGSGKTLYLRNEVAKLIIRAVCAYL